MGLRPEDVGDYVVFCFNEAVATFGSFVDGKLHECEGKNAAEVRMKQDAVMRRYVNSDNPASAKGQFADPALMFKN